MSIKLAIYALVFGAVAAVIGVLYWQNYNLRNDRDELRESNAKLTMAIAIQNKTIDDQAKAIGEWKDKLAEARETAERFAAFSDTASAELRRLKDEFANRSLRDAATVDPENVATGLSAGTARAFGLFERATGNQGQ